MENKEIKADHVERKDVFNLDIEKRFSFWYEKDDEIYNEKMNKMMDVRNKIKECAYFLISKCPNSRELLLALTHLEDCSMWANSAIIREDFNKGVVY